MATLTCPNCAAEVKPGDLICFTCGANLPRPSPKDDDYPAPATVMQEYLRPDERPGAISPAVLRLSFPTGNVEVPAGTSLLLGRDPAESLVAAAFAEFENVPGGMPPSASTTAAAQASATRTRLTAPTSMATAYCPEWRSASPTATSSGWARTCPPTSCCRASTPTRRRSAATNAPGPRR